MNGLFLNIFKRRTNSFYESAVSLSLAIFLSIAFVKLPFFHFLVVIFLIVTIYLFSKPYETFVLFLSLLIIFSHFSYAVSEGVKVIDIYSKGARFLPFSLMIGFLFFIFMAVLCSLNYRKKNDQFRLIDFSILVFLITSLIYISVSLLTDPSGISMEGARKAFHQFGVIGIVEFCLVYFIVNIVIFEKNRLVKLINFIFFITLIKASYGIMRYFFFGGEPRDYAARMGLNFKLTFFDIFDSAFFIFIFSFCFLNIFILSRKKIIFYIALIITLFNIVFSFRRTAWIGVILVLIYLSLKIGREKKILVYVIVLILLIPPLLSLISMRFGSLENSIGDISFDFSSSRKMGRFGELFYAIKSISKSPIFGHGVTGKYAASPSFDWAVPREIVHSSVLHIALKMGLVGLFILLLVIVGLYLLSPKHSKITLQDEEIRIIIYSAYSALIFLVPDFIFGTALVLFRHAAGYGIFVGLVRVSSKFLIPNHEIKSG